MSVRSLFSLADNLYLDHITYLLKSNDEWKQQHCQEDVIESCLTLLETNDYRIPAGRVFHVRKFSFSKFNISHVWKYLTEVSSSSCAWTASKLVQAHWFWVSLRIKTMTPKTYQGFYHLVVTFKKWQSPGQVTVISQVTSLPLTICLSLLLRSLLLVRITNY